MGSVRAGLQLLQAVVVQAEVVAQLVDHGVGDDLFPKMPGMKISPFPTLAKAKPGETVVFSFIVYKSKAHRDAVNKKVMKEMSEMEKQPPKMPFDMKRMAFGGFKTLVQA